MANEQNVKQRDFGTFIIEQTYKAVHDSRKIWIPTSSKNLHHIYTDMSTNTVIITDPFDEKSYLYFDIHQQLAKISFYRVRNV